ncbi:hypothetical protein [Streptomyces sp. NBC_00019]|uniref:hypothetical protein n=1 Tax=Streptomyces sp. NBC_00019 TaxID=2975623 RepID=UPI0032470392
MARGGRQNDTIIGVGRGRVYRPQGGKRIRRALGYTLGLEAGLLFVTLGFYFGLDNRAARLHFDELAHPSPRNAERGRARRAEGRPARCPELDTAAEHVRGFGEILTLYWSPDGTKGAANRIKKIRRQLYGRAGFEPLHKMVLPQ